MCLGRRGSFRLRGPTQAAVLWEVPCAPHTQRSRLTQQPSPPGAENASLAPILSLPPPSPASLFALAKPAASQVSQP